MKGEKNRKQLLTGALGHSESHQYLNQKNSTGFKGIQVNDSETAARERRKEIKSEKLTTRFFCSPAMAVIRSDMFEESRRR